MLTSSRRFFGRHWRGEYSLARSYFLHHFVIQNVLTVGIAATSFAAAMHLFFSSGHIFLATYLLMTSMIIVWLINLWSMTGVVISALKRMQEQHRYVLSYAILLLVIAQMVPLTWKAGTTILSGSRVGTKVEKKLEEEGKTLTEAVSFKQGEHSLQHGGFLTAESITSFNRLLDADKPATTVTLNSGGFGSNPSLQLGSLIRENGLDTYISEKCHGTCINSFLSGHKRIMHPEATLKILPENTGPYHLPVYYKPSTRERQRAEFLKQYGVNQRLIDYINAMHSSASLTLTAKQAKRYGLATHISTLAPENKPNETPAIAAGTSKKPF